jgi:hypothetical protein
VRSGRLPAGVASPARLRGPRLDEPGKELAAATPRQVRCGSPGVSAALAPRATSNRRKITAWYLVDGDSRAQPPWWTAAGDPPAAQASGVGAPSPGPGGRRRCSRDDLGLSEERRAKLQSQIGTGAYDGSVEARAKIVLWYDAVGNKAEVARMAGTSPPTVAKWVARYEEFGI